MFELLGDADRETVEAAARTLHRLLCSVEPRDYLGFDAAARLAWQTREHDAGAWARAFRTLTEFPTQRVAALAVASTHPSGWMREEAVRAMIESGDTRALPWLLVRTTDWFAPLGEVALQGVRALLPGAPETVLADSFALMARTEARSRPAALQAAEALTRRIADSPTALRMVLAATPLDRVARRRAWRLRLAASYDVNSAAIQEALVGPDELVRRRAVARVKELPASEARTMLLVRIAGSDPSGLVRRDALEALYDERSRLDATFVRGLAFDRSAAVRERAVWLLGVDGTQQAATLYREALSAEEPGRVAIALAALGRLGTRDDVPSILPFVDRGPVQVRKAALAAVAALGDADVDGLLMRALHDSSPGIVRVAGRCLGRRIGRLDVAALAADAVGALLPQGRRAARRLLAQRSVFEAGLIALHAMSGDDAEARRWAEHFPWGTMVTNARLGPTDARRLRTSLERAGERVPPHVRRALDFLARTSS